MSTRECVVSRTVTEVVAVAVSVRRVLRVTRAHLDLRVPLGRSGRPARAGRLVPPVLRATPVRLDLRVPLARRGLRGRQVRRGSRAYRVLLGRLARPVIKEQWGRRVRLVLRAR